MALVGLSMAGTKVFVSTSDPDYSEDGNHGEGATRFIIGNLDSYVRGRISDKLTQYVPPEGIGSGGKDETNRDGDGFVKININETALEACRFLIRDIEGFVDETGKEIPFKTRLVRVAGKKYKVVSDSIMERLDPDVIMEIYRFADLTNEVSEEEEGKSDAEW